MKLTTIVFALIGLMGPAAFAENLSDGQIVQVVQTANNADIAGGRLAESKAVHPDVRKFAREMVKDHSAANSDVMAVAKKNALSASNSDISGSLRRIADTDSARLKGLSGADFDKQYMEHEVSFHQDVLKTIDQTLIPNAKNEELKNLIMKIRPTIQGHLDEAKSIQAKL